MKAKTNSNGKMIAGSALILTLSTIAVKIFGLIYKVPLSYILSDEGMGYFNTAYSVYAFFYVLSTAGVPKAISVIIASESEEEAQKASKIAFRGFFLLGIAFTIIFLLLSRLFSNLLGSELSYLSMLSIAPSIAFVAAGGALRGYFNGKLKLIPIAVSEVISGVSKLVFGLIFAYWGQKLQLDIYEIAAFSIFGITIGSFLGFIYLYFLAKKSKGKKIKTKNLDIRSAFSYLGKIFKISIPLTATAAIGSFINLLDVSLVMRLLREDGFTELQANILYGNYTTLAIPMFNLVATLLAPIASVLLPMLVKDNSQAFKESFEKKTKLSLDIVIFITVPIAFIFWSFSDSILSFIFEDGSAKMAAPLLSALSFSIVFMGLLLIINTAIEGRGIYRLPLISLTVGSVSKLIFTGVFITNDKINLLAAPIGTLVSYLISFFISYIYLNKKEKIKLPIFKNLFLSAVFSLIALTAARIFDKSAPFTSWYLEQIILYTIYAIVYITLIFIYVLLSKTGQKIYNCDKKPQDKLSI